MRGVKTMKIKKREIEQNRYRSDLPDQGPVQRREMGVKVY